jgi:F-type H+-transporting ATPase subunit b
VRRRYWPAVLAGGLTWVASRPVVAAEEGAGETNIFNADIGNFLFTLVIFGLVIYLLRRFAWNPLLDVLSKREATIRETIEAAQRERAQAERLLADYQAQLAKAREEAAALVAEGRRDAEAVARRVQEQARRESEELLARARREIELATASARKELHDEASELAVMVAARIIQKELSPADHRELVARSLEEMQAAGKAKTN